MRPPSLSDESREVQNTQPMECTPNPFHDAQIYEGGRLLFVYTQNNNTVGVDFILQHPKAAQLVKLITEEGLTINFFAAISGNVNLLKQFIALRGDQVFAVRDHKKALNTALYEVSKLGHLEMVKCLVREFQADIYSIDNPGQELALHAAIQENHIEIVKFFISDMKIEVNRTYPIIDDGNSNKNVSILAYAARTSDLKLFRILVEECKANHSLEDQNFLPIHEAAFQGKKDVVEYCILKLGISIDVLSRYGKTPLYWAVRANSLETVQFLVDLKADYQTISIDGLLPPQVAAKYGYTKILRLFLQRGFPVEKRTDDNYQDSLLHLAAKYGKTSTVKMLVDEFGASLESKNQFGSYATHLAARNSCINVLKYLILTKKFDVNLQREHEGYTCLHLAARYSNLATVQFLVKKCKAKEDVRSKRGELPLHVAAAYNTTNMIYFLKDLGMSSQSLVEPNHQTLLHCAAGTGNLDAIIFLEREFKIDLSACDDNGWTAYHQAAANGHTSVVKHLAPKVGIDIKTEKSKETAIHLATKGKHLDTVCWLISNGADISLKTADERDALDFAITREHIDLITMLYSPDSWEQKNYGIMDSLINNQPKLLECILTHFPEPSKGLMHLKSSYSLQVYQIEPSANPVWKAHALPQELKALAPEELEQIIDKGLINAATARKNFYNSLGDKKGKYMEISIIEANLPLFFSLAKVEKDFFRGAKAKLRSPHINHILSFLFPAFLITPAKTILQAINKISATGLSPLAQNSWYAAFYIKLLEIIKAPIIPNLRALNTSERPHKLAKKNLHSSFQSDSKGFQNIVLLKNIPEQLHNAQTFDDILLLFNFTESNNEAGIEFILQHPKGEQLVKSLTKEGRTINFFAARSGNVNLLKKVIAIRGDQIFAVKDHKAALNTALYAASLHGHLEMVKYLVMELHADINWVGDRNEGVALYAALYKGHIPIIRFFISDMKMNVNAFFTNGYNLLSVAATTGNLQVFKILIEEFKANHAIMSHGNLPIHVAAIAGHRNIIEYCIIKLSTSMNVLNNLGETPLYLATSANKFDVVQFLVDLKADYQTISKDGFLPPHVAAQLGYTKILRSFLQRGFPVEKCTDTDFQSSLLILAADNGHPSTVEMLVEEFGASLSAKTYYGYCATHVAATHAHIKEDEDENEEKNVEAEEDDENEEKSDHRKVLDYLILTLKIDVNLFAGDEGYTCLHLAAWQANSATVKFLVENCKANINLRNKEGELPLHLAARHNTPNMIYFLKDQGMSPQSLVESNNQTVLHNAAGAGNLDAIIFLEREYKIDLLACDNQGHTAYHLAAEYGRTSVLKYLKKKVDINIKTPKKAININEDSDQEEEKEEGFTALHLAVINNRTETAYWLIREGAEVSLMTSLNRSALHHAVLQDNMDLIGALYSQAIWISSDMERNEISTDNLCKFIDCTLMHDPSPSTALMSIKRNYRGDYKTLLNSNSIWKKLSEQKTLNPKKSQEEIVDQSLINAAVARRNFYDSLTNKKGKYMEITIIEANLRVFFDLAMVEKNFFNNLRAKLNFPLINNILSFLLPEFLMTPPLKILQAINQKSVPSNHPSILYSWHASFYAKLLDNINAKVIPTTSDSSPTQPPSKLMKK